eukprot:TRINITY_DN28325_c0_g1_i1.p1 TRINITY_DN28325_c0_g1~~TRINITY_DN28325_c0_g1_i1.p1  ORF type:complete len:239 (+),score=24.79 TRINITY_DN28325_c0_g1_i1:59-775(+)
MKRVVRSVIVIGSTHSRKYCSDNAKQIVESTKVPEQEYQLTVDPETAHSHVTERYDAYQKYMKEVFVTDRHSRRQELRDSLSEAELARRTQEYGIYTTSVLTPYDKDNRWKGLWAATRVPKRHRTFRSRVARFSSNGLALLFGLYVAHWFTIHPEASVNIMEQKQSWHVYSYLPAFNFMFGTDYHQRWLRDVGPPVNWPGILIDGEPPNEDPVPPMFRFTSDEDNTEYIKRKKKGDYD